MKSSRILSVLAIVFVVLATQAFQCGSPDFTGAKLYENQQNWKDAVRLYQAEVQKNPGNAEAWFRMGRLKGERFDDYVGMNEAFNQALKLSSEHAQEIKIIRYNRWATHVNIGVELLKRANQDSVHLYDRSIEEFKLSADAWPDTGVSYKFMGHSYLSKRDLDNAIVAYTKAWNLDKDREAYLSVGKIYSQKGMDLKNKFETENADVLKAIRDVQEVDKGFYRNDIMRMFGAPDNVKKGPRNSRKEDWTYAKYNLTLTLEGEKVVDKKLAKPYEPSIDSSDVVASIAEFNKAITVFETLKAADPRDNENLNLLLQAYVEANRINEAKETFKLAVTNQPNNKMNHYILAVLYRTTGEYDNAVKEFEEALKIDPAFTDAMFDAGATYYNWGVDMLRVAQEKGDFEDVAYKEKFQLALPYLEKVSEVKKDDAAVWETLGTIYARLGQKDKAMKALDESDRIKRSR